LQQPPRPLHLPHLVEPPLALRGPVSFSFAGLEALAALERLPQLAQLAGHLTPQLAFVSLERVQLRIEALHGLPPLASTASRRRSRTAGRGCTIRTSHARRPRPPPPGGGSRIPTSHARRTRRPLSRSIRRVEAA